MKNIFIGRPVFWSLWVAVLGILFWLGKAQVHTRDFKFFLIVLVALVAVCVLTVVFGYRKGERITRDRLED